MKSWRKILCVTRQNKILFFSVAEFLARLIVDLSYEEVINEYLLRE